MTRYLAIMIKVGIENIYLFIYKCYFMFIVIIALFCFKNILNQSFISNKKKSIHDLQGKKKKNPFFLLLVIMLLIIQ